jgi:hypothetical protein
MVSVPVLVFARYVNFLKGQSHAKVWEIMIWDSVFGLN